MAAEYQVLLGYLNFSSGATDARFLAGLNDLYRQLEPDAVEQPDTWRQAVELLAAQLDLLEGQSPAFRDASQARGILALVGPALEAYREHHRDLLFHQPEAALWRPFFLGRLCESLLAQAGPPDEPARIIDSALAALNDTLGYRPVAVLHNSQRMAPYRHEWVRPIPLFIRGAGVAVGRYAPLVAQALDILRATDRAILAEAGFDLAALEELAVDTRAMDFDHPANKRPNHQFGWWDPHHLDGQARYCRFVLQQGTLDALLGRVAAGGAAPADELLTEAAAVLAGVALMASGTSGGSPHAHDSSVTLANLLPRIAAYRDRFYESFLSGLEGPLAVRLQSEAVVGRQPLAGARQDLNQALARMRASQVEHVQLAQLFARLGHAPAALRLADVVPATAARLVCQMRCALSSARRCLERGRPDDAARLAAEAAELLHRGIGCGALVDPWNILGFQGQFSLFPAPECSITDQRVEQLIELVAELFEVHARVWSEAAAGDRPELVEHVSAALAELARWWDQFATTTVQSVESFSGREAFESARSVARALGAWQRGDAAAGDLAFWRQHVEHFQSPKAYALVIAALLDKHDLVASRALLIQWIGRAADVRLHQDDHSFHELARRWLRRTVAAPELSAGQRAALAVRLFDLLEANADDYWDVPSLALEAPRRPHSGPPGDDDDDQPDDDLYRAAYDQMVYRDTTDDGVEGSLLESGSSATELEVEGESRRLRERLAFLCTLAALWRYLAEWAASPHAPPAESLPNLPAWARRARHLARDLERLLGDVQSWRLPDPGPGRESLLEFDRRRAARESLAEAVIASQVEMLEAACYLEAAAGVPLADDELESALARALHHALWGRPQPLRQYWANLLDLLAAQPLLYVPLLRGGDARKIVRTRRVQQALRDLLQRLPRLGLVRETCQLIEAARLAESRHGVGGPAVTEFDRLFDAGYRALVQALIEASRHWQPRPGVDDGEDSPDSLLLECLEQLTECLQQQWLAHARSLRLSVLERVAERKHWKPLVEFVRTHGRELFTQRFLHYGNLRAILGQGVDNWLARLESAGVDQEEGGDLPARFSGAVQRAAAVKHLGLVIEAVAENYGEYRDYNSTTTQSDRGDLLYTLLDFLRLRVEYDRVAWNLRPVVLAHEALARHGLTEPAAIWRRALAERTEEVADSLQSRLAELSREYGMRLPTVADHLAQRFVRPLAVDRVRALVLPAAAELRSEAPGPAVAALVEEAEDLVQQPTGAGLDVPEWLATLADEVDRVTRASTAPPPAARPQVPLALGDLQQQLLDWQQESP